MANFANIVLKDGAAVPADHTFAVSARGNGLLQWDDRSEDVVAGFRTITSSYRAPKGNTVGKVVLKIVNPRLGVTAPSSGTGLQPNPVAAYHCVAKVEFLIHPAADSLARSDILAYTKNLLANAQIVDLIKDLNPPV